MGITVFLDLKTLYSIRYFADFKCHYTLDKYYFVTSYVPSQNKLNKFPQKLYL